jgi:mannan endo-1,4-beta-mannosidase
MHVAGRFLYDAKNERVVLRGVNKMTIWLDVPAKLNSFPEIERTGANVTRIVWNDTGSPADLDLVISQCVASHMIPMIEDHDATGDLSQLPRVLAYWTRPDIVSVLKKHSEYLLLNIANEAGNDTVTDDAFLAAYTSAIRALRGVGLTMPLVIDAPDWGKNLDVLLHTADRLTATDPFHNVMYSVHMYWRYSQGATDPMVAQKLHESVTRGIPLIVGEFSAYVTDGSSDKDSIRYNTILEQSAADEIGWIVWEWGPGNMDEKTGKMMPWMGLTTDGKFSTLNGWGKDIVLDHKLGIAKTSRRPSSITNRR